MKYILILLTCAFFAQVHAQIDEQNIIEDAVKNDYSIEKDTQSVFDFRTPQLDTIGYDTISVDPDTLVPILDTIGWDSTNKAQYRFEITYSGDLSGTVYGKWRDSSDHKDFANGIIESIYSKGYRLERKAFEEANRFPREVNQSIGEGFISWARNKYGSAFKGDYTLVRRDSNNVIQQTSVTVYGGTGALLKDNDGNFVTSGTRLATIRYLCDGYLRLTLFFDDTGNLVNLHIS